jgi:hypothetical protein
LERIVVFFRHTLKWSGWNAIGAIGAAIGATHFPMSGCFCGYYRVYPDRAMTDKLQQGKKTKLLQRLRRKGLIQVTVCRGRTGCLPASKGRLFSSSLPGQAFHYFGLGDIRPDAISVARPKNSGVDPKVAGQSCSRGSISGGEPESNWCHSLFNALSSQTTGQRIPLRRRAKK